MKNNITKIKIAGYMITIFMLIFASGFLARKNNDLVIPFLLAVTLIVIMPLEIYLKKRINKKINVPITLLTFSILLILFIWSVMNLANII
ncbi:hypothetical protein J2Z83_003146 [Virgibacillus natechei]|uniref:DUF3953 domain-containing protein n=1 Tax=Virgibacillus natechei TaxID=1216297 RepID=A0ABS4IJA2_9BACI|nr:hypothetical protein [Virgibacillus natechei]MBP1971009.1 hypothetical protein [Virgibacillus natechei]UZD12768.1 hypothetical protein OLD84_18060 [Virgibacillus natechei]